MQPLPPPELENQFGMDLSEVLKIIGENKLRIALSALLFGVFGAIISLTFPNYYTVETVLRPRTDNNLGSVAAKFGGLANLAGLSVPNLEEDSKTELALEIIRSKKFIWNFVNKYQILPQVYAAKEWDWETSTIIFDDSIYDNFKGAWVRKVDPPLEPRPGVEEIFEFWTEDFLSIEQNPNSGFITIRLEHALPIQTTEWLNILVEEINAEVRQQELAEADVSIKYLQEKLRDENRAEIKDLLNGLLRTELESKMIAEVQVDFVFSTIDPPAVPRIKSGPNRALVSLFATALGALMAFCFVILKSTIVKRTD